MADHVLMLDSIMAELRQKCKNKGEDCEICARMAETIEAAKQALSHAAGQEAETIYQVSIDGMCDWMDVSRAEYEHHVIRGVAPTRIVYTKPSTSAEVGRDD